MLLGNNYDDDNYDDDNVDDVDNYDDDDDDGDDNVDNYDDDGDKNNYYHNIYKPIGMLKQSKNRTNLAAFTDQIDMDMIVK